MRFSVYGAFAKHETQGYAKFDICLWFTQGQTVTNKTSGYFIGQKTLAYQTIKKKDRIVPMSDKLLEMLREYYKTFKSNVWLFEGQQAGDPYSERHLEQVFKNALKQSGIKKPATIHWLRHSYATPLLESETDLRYIQALLGHKSSKSTEIYTHVSPQSIQQTKSPFDDL